MSTLAGLDIKLKTLTIVHEDNENTDTIVASTHAILHVKISSYKFLLNSSRQACVAVNKRFDWTWL